MCPLDVPKTHEDGAPIEECYYSNSWPSNPDDILIIPLAYDVPIDEEGIVCYDFWRE